MGIYLICFGQSEENVEIALKEKAIGVTIKKSFDSKSKAYLIVKRKDGWTVIARANIIGESKINPFEKPNKLHAYKIDYIEQCIPYAISDLLKTELGNMYGLALRTPSLITADTLIQKMDNMFCKK